MKKEETEQLVKLQTCHKDMKSWMSSNFRLLNSGKTEVMVFGSEPLRDRLDHMITLVGISLTSSLSVRNLGITFDQNLSFNSHIKTVSRSAPFHLRNITKIRKLLTQHDAEKLVHAFVTSRLDYCNSLLSVCPNTSLRSLQVIQNAAARVLTGSDKRDHVLRGLAPSYLKELVTPYHPMCDCSTLRMLVYLWSPESLELTQPASVTVQPGQRLTITCQVSYSVSSYWTSWVRQPAGKGLEWIGQEYTGTTYFKDSLKNKFSISLDSSSNTVTLNGVNV
ncbi:Immunoglobulin heavy variable 4-39 [Takifugu flavidus]|nr:Immunoglobulin heavy variable 4-39 [Takifugu flavidus]